MSPVSAVVELMMLSMTLVRLFRLGQANRKFAAFSQSGTRRNHATAMQLREHAHQSETNAEAGSGARSCFICLYEEIKNVRQHIVRNADPRISDAEVGVAVARMHRERRV